VSDLPSQPLDKLAAARGQIDLPPEARLELLVALTDEDDVDIRSEARRTLSAWSTDDLTPILRRRATSPDTLKYFLHRENLRSDLLPVLLANRSTPQESVADLAAEADMDTVRILLDNIDRLRTKALTALRDNSSYLSLYENRLTAVDDGFVFEPNLLEMLIIEARLEDEREGKVGLTDEEIEEHDKAIAEADSKGDEEKKNQSIYAKVAKMSVSQKVQLALKGNKEERAMLIRDASKVVTRAVLNSPKLTDSEVESFSNSKNVNDEVLRLISMSRKFMKSYSTMRNLVNNPKTPIDVAMTLLPRLVITDVRGVAGNKNVSEVVRKMAIKLAKQKASG
jgi:hypothetical protein